MQDAVLNALIAVLAVLEGEIRRSAASRGI